ncbi:hypothetical protein J5N97_027936 [Dioscorea zingiberensis]|uniref:Protein MIZU-KUSSEI 1 n=1 Tax=Dioscorea zingiberensis TaxID=325984 RepID=A0A9D5BY58_9LILI|nr:hypothetical protein J5N97_027936 [Dioscorea zingiberensis]
MARTPLESSSSRRHFQWISRGSARESDNKFRQEEPIFFSDEDTAAVTAPSPSVVKKRTQSSAAVAVMRLRSVITALIAGRDRLAGLGPRVTGTIFGRRRGHVKLAFQADRRSCPAILVELAKPTSALVREMASGLVRIALECERRVEKSSGRLLDEPLWHAYCNGRKCGFAVRRECSAADWKVLKAIEPVTMGAGVLPGDGDEPEGEMMFMRARFERVVGSRDSEAFYMMNPDGHSGAELSAISLPEIESSIELCLLDGAEGGTLNLPLGKKPNKGSPPMRSRCGPSRRGSP